MHSNGKVFILLLLSFDFFITIEGNNKSYHIPSIRANWFKANEFCNSLKMRLVIIRSQEENDAVGKYVQTTDKFSEENCSFWTGATDLAEEGSFIWVGTGERVTYTNWRKGEPNDESGNEDCIQLAYIPSLNYKWHWNDNTCAGQSFYFICENIDWECVQQF